jgi:hypothetical protein
MGVSPIVTGYYADTIRPRFLQSHDPRARPRIDRTPCHRVVRALSSQHRLSFSSQGPDRLSPNRARSPAISRAERSTPTSSTRTPLVADSISAAGWRAGFVVESAKQARFRKAHCGGSCASPLPRRSRQVAAPEVPFIERRPPQVVSNARMPTPLRPSSWPPLRRERGTRWLEYQPAIQALCIHARERDARERDATKR